MQKTLLSSYTKKSDKSLILLVKKKSDENAFLEICRRYENLFYKVCQKYSTALSNSGVNTQDIFDEKTFIIYHCILTFNSDKKTKLSTWIGNYARYLCLNAINSRKFILPTIDEETSLKIEDLQTSQSYLSQTNSPDDYNYILNIINQLKDQRVNEIFKFRYFNDKKMIWSKIAKEMNISAQTAINLHNKGIKMLRKKMKSKNISDIV